MTEIQYIPTNQIVFNPFEQMVINRDKVNEIKASILQHRDNGTKGLLQVPTARFVLSNGYELAFGKHRALAFPEGMDEDEVLKDLDDMRKADALKHMRRVLAYAMIERYMYMNDIEVEDTDKKPVIKHAKNLEGIAAVWEVKLPKDFMSQAEAYQAELDQQLKEIEPKKAKK